VAVYSRFVSGQDWSNKVLIISAIAALAIVLAAYPMKSDSADWRRRMGPANWDFSKSWAANLTVFFAAVGTIFAANLLPDGIDSSVTKTFAALNVLFGIAALVGPFIYIVLQRRVPVTRTAGRGTAGDAQYQGTLGGFLLGTAVTLWAVLGEFGTAIELIRTTHGHDALPPSIVVAFSIVLGVAALLVVTFLATRIRAIAGDQGEEMRTFRAGLRRAGISEDELHRHVPALPPVPVL
jgi:hypothetical protein